MPGTKTSFIVMPAKAPVARQGKPAVQLAKLSAQERGALIARAAVEGLNRIHRSGRLPKVW